MRGNHALDLTDTCERAVPSQLQFRRDQPVLRIDGVVLPECPIGGSFPFGAGRNTGIL